MARRIVDTNVVSYLLKGDTRATLYAPHLDGYELCVAFLTVAELYRWAIQRRWGQSRIHVLLAKLADFTILPYDDEMAWAWARVMSLKGNPVSAGDAWIAAAAIRHGLPLVTHNRRHFEVVQGLQLISEG